MTSPRASGSGLPCSWVSVRAIASARCRIRSAVPLRILARSYADSARQAGNAFAAASMARSASARPPKATSTSVDSSAGLITGSVLPPIASDQRPSMNICEGSAEEVAAMMIDPDVTSIRRGEETTAAGDRAARRVHDTPILAESSRPGEGGSWVGSSRAACRPPTEPERPGFVRNGAGPCGVAAGPRPRGHVTRPEARRRANPTPVPSEPETRRQADLGPGAERTRASAFRPQRCGSVRLGAPDPEGADDRISKEHPLLSRIRASEFSRGASGCRAVPRHGPGGRGPNRPET